MSKFYAEFVSEHGHSNREKTPISSVNFPTYILIFTLCCFKLYFTPISCNYMQHTYNTLKPFTAVLALGKMLRKLLLQELLFSTAEPQPTVFSWNIQDSPGSVAELLPLKNREPVTDKGWLSVGGSVCVGAA